MKKVAIILLAVTLSAIAKKELITVKTERAELISIKPELADGRLRSFKYNRTVTAVNVSFVLHVPVAPGDKVAVQAYKFASNEYRQFPVIFDAKICSSLVENYFGMRNLGNCGNFTARCPIAPGFYQICNWTPDYKKFPPHLVTGQFKIQMKFILQSQEATVMNWYIVVANEMIEFEKKQL